MFVGRVVRESTYYRGCRVRNSIDGAVKTWVVKYHMVMWPYNHEDSVYRFSERDIIRKGMRSIHGANPGLWASTKARRPTDAWPLVDVRVLGVQSGSVARTLSICATSRRDSDRLRMLSSTPRAGQRGAPQRSCRQSIFLYQRSIKRYCEH
jgi:hypothetical protein